MKSKDFEAARQMGSPLEVWDIGGVDDYSAPRRPNFT